jgi:hypothetical protein
MNPLPLRQDRSSLKWQHFYQEFVLSVGFFGVMNRNLPIERVLRNQNWGFYENYAISSCKISRIGVYFIYYPISKRGISLWN